MFGIYEEYFALVLTQRVASPVPGYGSSEQKWYIPYLHYKKKKIIPRPRSLAILEHQTPTRNR